MSFDLETPSKLYWLKPVPLSYQIPKHKNKPEHPAPPFTPIRNAIRPDTSKLLISRRLSSHHTIVVHSMFTGGCSDIVVHTKWIICKYELMCPRIADVRMCEFLYSDHREFGTFRRQATGNYATATSFVYLVFCSIRITQVLSLSPTIISWACS